MKHLRLLILLLLLVAPSPVWADAVDDAYQKAKKDYRALLDSSKKQLFRDNWEALIQRFVGLADQHGDHPRAADSLFMAAQACRGMYQVSRANGDGRGAAELYDRLAERYPRNTLADDALFEAAKIHEEILSQKAEAFIRYQAIVDRYGDGDMFAKARSKAVSLVAFAPAPKAFPAPPEPLPVSAEPAPSAAAPSPAAEGKEGPAALTGVRLWSNPGHTRIVLDMDGVAEFKSNLLPASPSDGLDARIYVDLLKTVPGSEVPEKTSVEDGLLRQVRTGRPDPETVRVVFDLVSSKTYKVFALQDPFRIVVDVLGEEGAVIYSNAPELRALPPTAKDEVAKVLAAEPAAALVPAKPAPGTLQPGLRRIVVDAGHGGKDPGAVGPSGLREKDITLAMAKELKKQLEGELGCEVILTRNRDVYIPLEERTAIANKVGADLFISLHVNASHKSEAHGVETYYLNFSKNDKAAAVAARENGTSLKQVGDLELILFDLMANAKINESSRLAAEIQKSMVGEFKRHYPDTRDLGVKQGPFYVLVGATMPSVLVEAAFISHPREESRLATAKFQEKTGAAIVKGVRNYATDLKLIAHK